jgi:hypothetical protein
MPRKKKNTIQEQTRINKKTNVQEKIEDEALKQLEKRKRARLRTRGPYRKANIETQRD